MPTVSDRVTIDASSQPGYAGSPQISLVAGASRQFGFQLLAGSDYSTVRGFNIQGFSTAGIYIESSYNTIAGNWIGVNATGTAAAANGNGIDIWQGDNNILGGTGTYDRNVISGNSGNGVAINSSANNTQILGNYVGLNATGTAAIANGNHGLDIYNSSGTIIGNGSVAGRNVISGNTAQGIFLYNSANSVIQGNYIGTNAAGTADINGTTINFAQSGIVLTNGSTGNLIGGTTAAQRNVISGNNWYGVEFIGAGTSNNSLFGNYIGTDATGFFAIANISGVSMYNAASNNQIGSGAAGAGNVISGNLTYGVFIANNNATGNKIQGNLIGLAKNGSTIVGNASSGVYISDSATSNVIGTDGNGVDDIAERNIISGNANGVEIESAGVTGNIVAGNYIGTDITGMYARANIGDGVRMFGGASSNTIGGTAAYTGNLIGGNSGNGIYIGSGGSNTVAGNIIGLNASGGVADGGIISGNVGSWQGEGDAADTRLTANGTLFSGTTFTNGHQGQAFQFDGVDDYVEIADNVAHQLQTLTVSAWIKPDFATMDNFGGIVMKTSDATWANGFGLSRDGSNNGVRFYIDNWSTNFASATVADNAWSFVTGTFDGTTVKLYVNGVLAGTDTYTGPINYAASTLRIGSGYSSNLTWKGGIDEANLFNRALTATEIGELYQYGLNVKLGNTGYGVSIVDSASNLIGGTSVSARNVISHNSFGIVISGAGSTLNTVAGNYIGTTASGNNAAGNTYDGIQIFNSSAANTIGGATSSYRNIISGNGGDGIHISGENSDGNIIRNNWVGMGADGSTVLGNGRHGIAIMSGADNTVIGGIGVGNVIIGSRQNGIHIDGDTSGSIIQGNFIGTNVAGSVVVDSGEHGIWMGGGAKTIPSAMRRRTDTITASGQLLGAQRRGESTWIRLQELVTRSLATRTSTTPVWLSTWATWGHRQRRVGAQILAREQSAKPVLTSATTNGTVLVSGNNINTLASVTGMVIHFYASPNAGNMNRRDAKRYLGSTTVNTDASGNATFTNLSLSSVVAAGEVITATTTPGANGSTSAELSQAVVATLTSGNSLQTT
ncbi:MAG: LamG-like jellyroll fold domain-containing protein [Pirellulaceae bacterium]